MTCDRCVSQQTLWSVNLREIAWQVRNERDPDLCKLIDRCEKPLTPLKYAKLLYDFGNACHPDDWEYISGCFMSSLKSYDDFQDFYTKFKYMYEEICECD